MDTEATAADEGVRPDPEPEPRPNPPGRAGIAGLAPGYQLTAALALAAIALVTGLHVLMVFLHVAPSNTLSKQYGRDVDDWVYPEFEQNWKLFAPNPLQQNVAVQARGEVRTRDGDTRQTRWYDLSAADGAAIDGNLLPSHTQQNELRRAWDVYGSTHDAQNRPTGLRGTLSERYLRRILVLRLDRLGVTEKGETLERVQVRSRSVTIEPPKWSTEKVNRKPFYREIPWWSVTAYDAPLDTGARVRVQGPAGEAR
ncbi:DUF5819 family protein [Streptomyces xanthii]|uniref:Uncharacterized protein n=1 Tax=Streptomyces xanthii TaxID=2768069 RepID=A0A7H1B9A8_9ACTN|nr:DUF5819 family protein [Streptomyces xanthii]QNS05313.1 hypothetical protein IAG42_18045 [Streptomyces xanthii]